MFFQAQLKLVNVCNAKTEIMLAFTKQLLIIIRILRKKRKFKQKESKIK